MENSSETKLFLCVTVCTVCQMCKQQLCDFVAKFRNSTSIRNYSFNGRCMLDLYVLCQNTHIHAQCPLVKRYRRANTAYGTPYWHTYLHTDIPFHPTTAQCLKEIKRIECILFSHSSLFTILFLSVLQVGNINSNCTPVIKMKFFFFGFWLFLWIFRKTTK